ncbi:hypothetical protein C8R43DRAFT_886645 [Mycena crocata]|nr:hypothetical protein C8R43DRAFT_886645 [Mycena crocata]
MFTQCLLLEPSRRFNSLDEEIAVLQIAIDKLRDHLQRENVGAYLDAHRALICPVGRLPLEIIQEILTACLPTNRNCVMSATEAPVLLGRICSSWRAISITTPRIWSSLHIIERGSFAHVTDDTEALAAA